MVRTGSVSLTKGGHHEHAYRLPAESFRTTSRGGGLLAEDLERLRDYGESGWEIDHIVAHGENQNAMLFVFSE
jgi:hypothetical protein